MTNKNKLMIGASVASVSVATTLIVMKAIAFFITGSIAILASLFDSVQDLMTSAINFFTVRHSLQPADTKHRFGHGKAQGIGSFVQGLILLGSALWLAFESVIHLGQQEIPTHSVWGIGVTLLALVLTGILIRFQMFVIRQTESLSIRADNAHYNGDLMMNMGVLISLMFSYIFSVGWIDCVFGIGVSVYLLKSALYILREAVAMLMDEELPKHVQNKIKIQLSVLKEIKKIQDLRTRQSGCQIFIQMTLILDGNMPLSKAHSVADKAESLIHEIYPDSEIMIHLEPEE